MVVEDKHITSQNRSSSRSIWQTPWAEACGTGIGSRYPHVVSNNGERLWCMKSTQQGEDFLVLSQKKTPRCVNSYILPSYIKPCPGKGTVQNAPAASSVAGIPQGMTKFFCALLFVNNERPDIGIFRQDCRTARSGLSPDKAHVKEKPWCLKWQVWFQQLGKDINWSASANSQQNICNYL